MHEFRVRVGPASFRLLSSWAKPIVQLRALYADYPTPDIPDFTVRLEPVSFLRRFVRPSAAIQGDYMLPDAAPLPLNQGMLGLEMGMNLQMALGWRRQMILHASAVARDGKALVMTGESGSGKSTLAAMLGQQKGPNSWRFMGDEFALIDPQTGKAVPYPRLISLKNEAIAAMEQNAADGIFGPLMCNTPKGDIRHLVPPGDAIAQMGVPATPALLLFPRYGQDAAIREVPPSEAFMRLTQASTNYVALGEAGFHALSKFVRDVPARAIDYRSSEEAYAMVEQLWDELS